jgi:hypothetical protein
VSLRFNGVPNFKLQPMKTFLTMILLLIFAQANSQTPDWVWCEVAQSAGGGAGEGTSVAVDDADNVYIGGWYAGSITFGATTLTNTLGAFIGKYDSNGNVQWADGSLGNQAQGNDICIDKDNNVYMVGQFEAGVMFGSQIIFSAGQNDVYIVKYDGMGNALWARSAGGANFDDAYGVACDLSGNVYVTGQYQSPTFVAENDSLINPGLSGIFLVKYDSSGNVLWARSSTDGGTFGYGVATDALGNVFITGIFSSDSISFGSQTIHRSGSFDLFLAKYDSSGNALWVKGAVGTNEDWAFKVATDASNNVYLTGRYKSSPVIFDSDTLANTGDFDGFLVKYNPSGNVIWVKSITDTLAQSVRNLTVDNSNRVYVTGGFTSPSVTFDSITIAQPMGSTDPMFIAGYDSSGNLLFAKGVASGGDDWCGVAVSKSYSCIYVGGDFVPTILLLGNDTIVVNGGQENAFLGKLCYPQIGENILEAIKENEFVLYPNPFEDKLNISVKENGQAEIILYDILSRRLSQKKFTNSTTLNTEQLAKGIYIYEVRNKNGVIQNGKIVKE